MNGQHFDEHSLGASLPCLALAAACFRQRVHIAEGAEVNDCIASHLSRNAQPISYLVKVKEIAVEQPPASNLISKRLDPTFCHSGEPIYGEQSPSI
ncbi:hypothetical protein KAM385_08060 [Aeromonas hydrophila]|nr:hypothetical protein KAM385_08060 [Aeromonas hydrophila]